MAEVAAFAGFFVVGAAILLTVAYAGEVGGSLAAGIMLVAAVAALAPMIRE